ncbi:hypothetical protein L2E82_17575 [Cichorium intybus]|uniref:Uncharacterized protein n=1 Tax=Cichorium intybus TaxID=13427 RepID=A0ACB9F907_CICIN|nr:hypothetical protein L2E82_17575 [Cichorium intybus]
MGVTSIEERDEFIKLGDGDISDSYVIDGRGSIVGATEYDGFWCERDESNLIKFSRLRRPAAPASQTTIMAGSIASNEYDIEQAEAKTRCLSVLVIDVGNLKIVGVEH